MVTSMDCVNWHDPVTKPAAFDMHLAFCTRTSERGGPMLVGKPALCFQSLFLWCHLLASCGEVGLCPICHGVPVCSRTLYICSFVRVVHLEEKRILGECVVLDCQTSEPMLAPLGLKTLSESTGPGEGDF